MTGRTRDLGRVLVTGALGFLGAALVKSLEVEGAEVVATNLDPVRRRLPALRCDRAKRGA